MSRGTPAFGGARTRSNLGVKAVADDGDVAHGGGAEVLPLGTFNHTDSLAASWFANNNGFSPDEAWVSLSISFCFH